MTANSTEETTDDIMQATYCALCEHGYADLTMQDIADRTDASKSSLHYHYDTKHDLLVAFLDHLLDEFAGRFDDDTDDPLDRLEVVLETTLEDADDEHDRDFQTAVLEIKAQAPYDDAYRERLETFDERLAGTLQDIVADGVESGAFRADADPRPTAEFLITAIDGAHTRAIATDHPLAAARAYLAEYVERDLLADDVSREVDLS